MRPPSCLVPIIVGQTLTLALACGPGPGPQEVPGVQRTAEVAQCLIIEDPALLELPELEEGCSTRRALTVRNDCAFPVRVSGISLEAQDEPDDLVLVKAPAIPTAGRVVPAGGALSLAVRYQPRNAGSHSSRLAVMVEGTEAAWTLTGSARQMGRITDTYKHEAPTGSDVLIVIDNGPLLAAQLQGVRANLSSFARYIAHSSRSRHVGITTTSGPGRAELAGGVLDARSATFENQVEAILIGLETGPGLEDPLQVAVEVAHKAQPGGPYAALFQTLRHTAIVIVSAGPDRSPQTADFYREWLHHLAGEGSNARWRLAINVIGPFSFWSGATTTSVPDCGALPDDGVLYRMAERTHGIIESICTPDWSKSLEWLGKAALGYGPPIFLSESPDLLRAPIELSVGGVPVPAIGDRGESVWRFDPVSNAVVLEPIYGPEPGQTVEFTYSPRCPDEA